MYVERGFLDGLGVVVHKPPIPPEKRRSVLKAVDSGSVRRKCSVILYPLPPTTKKDCVDCEHPVGICDRQSFFPGDRTCVEQGQP
jgi:hypothetical protein